MGTTIVLAVVYNDIVHVSHIGDSRAYIISDEDIIQITV